MAHAPALASGRLSWGPNHGCRLSGLMSAGVWPANPGLATGFRAVPC